jgi:RNA polymerase sigma-70 factor (ECF subfamily)
MDSNDPFVECPLVALVHRTMRGDHAAFAALHEQTARQVFRTVRRLLACNEDAEEVVCDVFTFVWQQADAYDTRRGSVRAWLTIIARNRSIDRLRQRHATRTLRDDRYAALAESLVCPASGPEQSLVRQQTRTALEGALQSLSVLRRQLIELSFFEELSHEQIAQAVCVPLGTVKSHVRRSLASLRRQLDGEYGAGNAAGNGEIRLSPPGDDAATRDCPRAGRI